MAGEGMICFIARVKQITQALTLRTAYAYINIVINSLDWLAVFSVFEVRTGWGDKPPLARCIHTSIRDSAHVDCHNEAVRDVQCSVEIK